MNDLVLFREDILNLNRILAQFIKAVPLDCAMLSGKDGQLITYQGLTQSMDMVSVAALVTGSFNATGVIATVVGEKEFTTMVHRGGQKTLHISLVDSNTYMTAVVESSIGVDRVNYYMAECVKQLKSYFAEMNSNEAPAPGLFGIDDESSDSSPFSPFDQLTDGPPTVEQPRQSEEAATEGKNLWKGEVVKTVNDTTVGTGSGNKDINDDDIDKAINALLGEPHRSQPEPADGAPVETSTTPVEETPPAVSRKNNSRKTVFISIAILCVLCGAATVTYVYTQGEFYTLRERIFSGSSSTELKRVRLEKAPRTVESREKADDNVSMRTSVVDPASPNTLSEKEVPASKNKPTKSTGVTRKRVVRERPRTSRTNLESSHVRAASARSQKRSTAANESKRRSSQRKKQSSTTIATFTPTAPSKSKPKNDQSRPTQTRNDAAKEHPRPSLQTTSPKPNASVAPKSELTIKTADNASDTIPQESSTLNKSVQSNKQQNPQTVSNAGDKHDEELSPEEQTAAMSSEEKSRSTVRSDSSEPAAEEKNEKSRRGLFRRLRKDD
ncbi:MAG: hypothetical protein GF344_11185 [Chitinivibrionales bacterium]|nr:hypothetical protein [Chitinivibrionales bacterium]MBD3357366.1 hypothetical protein [Chitinivibrionales bacterium]